MAASPLRSKTEGTPDPRVKPLQDVLDPRIKAHYRCGFGLHFVEGGQSYQRRKDLMDPTALLDELAKNIKVDVTFTLEETGQA